jgi:hypothetical protein
LRLTNWKCRYCGLSIEKTYFEIAIVCGELRCICNSAPLFRTQLFSSDKKAGSDSAPTGKRKKRREQRGERHFLSSELCEAAAKCV